MRVLITGSTGFVGRNLSERLHAAGFQVSAVGRSAGVGADLRERGIAFKTADIRLFDQVVGAFSPADCVIHCAALAGPWGTRRDYCQTNVVGTRHVISACRRHRIKKLIFVSTPSLYYDGTDRYNIVEDDPLPEKTASVYAQSKLISEKELLAQGADGFKVIIFRPRAIFGPYDRTFVPRILKMASGKKIPLINGGQAMVDLTCVDNFVDAVQKGLNAPDNAWNQVYNISNGQPLCVKAWFEQVLEIFGKPFQPRNVPEPAAIAIASLMELYSYLPFVKKEPPMTRFSVGYMARSMTLCIDKARTMLGYTPAIGNREGFERYANWVRRK